MSVFILLVLFPSNPLLYYAFYEERAACESVAANVRAYFGESVSAECREAEVVK